MMLCPLPAHQDWANCSKTVVGVWFREGVWLTASLGLVVQTCHHAFVVVGVLE